MERFDGIGPGSKPRLVEKVAETRPPRPYQPDLDRPVGASEDQSASTEPESDSVELTNPEAPDYPLYDSHGRLITGRHSDGPDQPPRFD